jgi:DNA helicase-2/ATP-dependent DNA helicase PcrA
MPSTRLNAAVDNTPVAPSFVDSEDQKRIYAWFRDGKPGDNLVVQALAGTGKTTTILKAIDFAPEKDILLAAFNKRIQTELSERLANPNAQALTLHALGYRMLRNAIGFIPTNKRYEREEAIGLKFAGSLGYGASRLIGKIATKAREITPFDHSMDTLLNLAEEFDLIPTPRDSYTLAQIVSAVQRALDWAKNPESARATGIDFADMIYLPLVNDMVQGVFDLVVVDEYQDMHNSQLTLALRSCKPGGRIALVGDTHQAIYSFRGVSAESLRIMKDSLSPLELPLAKTYRCPKSVVALARQFVPHYQVDESAPDGVVDSVETLNDVVSRAQAGDFVLSRKNAPLAKAAMRFLVNDKPARIVGRDIGATLRNLVKVLSVGDAAHSIPAFLRKLSAYEAQQVARLTAEKHFHRIDELADKCDTLRIFAESAKGVPGLIEKIDMMFVDNPGAYVICSTVHKAKGLEAQNVFLLNTTFFMPKGEPQEEANIYYVAVTRAKAHLTMCMEKF